MKKTTSHKTEAPKQQKSEIKTKAPAEVKAHKAPAEAPAPAAAEIPDPTVEVNEVLSPDDEATKLEWWKSLSEAEHHALLKQANSIFAAVAVDPGTSDRVTHAWRLFQAGRIAL